MQQKSIKKLILIVVLGFAILGFFVFDLSQYFSLEYIKLKQQAFSDFYQANVLTTLLAFSGVYIGITALSLPGAAVMTLLAGALFGFWVGTLLVSFSSTIGATLAFLVARFLFKDFVQQRYAKNLRVINKGVETEGAFYLFTLRLVPLFPFFLINLVMGVTPIKTLIFLFVSWIGMLPGTMAYIFAGTQLGQITSLKGILSPTLILAFVILGLFPLVAKKSVDWLKKRQNKA